MKLPSLIGKFFARLSNVFSFFDIAPCTRKRNLDIFSLIFFVAISIIICQYCLTALKKAESKDFWGDEKFGLSVARGQSYGSLIVDGAGGQGSPSPLDYIILKAISGIRNSFGRFDIPPNVYYRLHTICYSILAGLLVTFLMYSRVRRTSTNYFVLACQLLLITRGLVSFYFSPWLLHFSVETRPYSLWNALWFVTLGVYVYYRRINIPVVIFMVLLAGTATASIYQLFSFGLAWLIVQIWDRKPWRDIFIMSLKYIALPTFVALYYIFVRSQKWGYTVGMEEQYYHQFFEFWTKREMIPILSVFGILLTSWIKELRAVTVVFMAMLILYLLSPMINYITIQHGFFFSTRQYIYYTLAYPFFFIVLALAMPEYLKKMRKPSRTEDY